MKLHSNLWHKSQGRKSAYAAFAGDSSNFKCKSHDPPMQFPDLLMTVGPEERERIQSTIAHWDCLVMTKILRESKKVQTASPFGAYSTDRWISTQITLKWLKNSLGLCRQVRGSLGCQYGHKHVDSYYTLHTFDLRRIPKRHWEQAYSAWRRVIIV